MDMPTHISIPTEASDSLATQSNNKYSWGQEACWASSSQQTVTPTWTQTKTHTHPAKAAHMRTSTHAHKQTQCPLLQEDYITRKTEELSSCTPLSSRLFLCSICSIPASLSLFKMLFTWSNCCNCSVSSSSDSVLSALMASSTWLFKLEQGECGNKPSQTSRRWMMSAPPLLPSLRHSSLDDTADDDKGGQWRGVSRPPSPSCPPPHPLLPAVLALGILSQLSPPLFLKLFISALKICSRVNQNHFLSFKIPHLSFTPLFFLHQTTSDKVRQHRDKKVSNVMINWIHILLYRSCERLKSALIRPLNNNKMFWQQKSFCMLPPHGVWHMDWNIQKKQKKDAEEDGKSTRDVLRSCSALNTHPVTSLSEEGITQVSHISKPNKMECFYCHINACCTLLNYDLYLSTSA